MVVSRLEQGVIMLIYEYNQSGFFIRILDYANFPAFLRACCGEKKNYNFEVPISRVRKYLIKF